MEYFRLTTDCYLAEAQNGAAIYDIHESCVYLLDEATRRILRRCENNQPLSEWADDHVMALLNRLQDLGIGSFQIAPYYVDKFLLSQPVEWLGMCSQPPAFFQVDWSVTNNCDLSCNFCGRGREALVWRACHSCIRREASLRSEWSPDDPEDLVVEIANAGARLINLRGGNPLLRWEYLLRVVGSAGPKSVGVLITTAGTGRSVKDIINLYRNGNVRLNLVMFGITEQPVATMTGQAGILQQQLDVGDALYELGLPFFVVFIIPGGAQHLRSRMAEFARRRWSIDASFSEFYFRSSLSDGVRLSHVTGSRKPLNRWRSPDEFFARLRYNACTHSLFELGADGKLRTCAGLEQIHGDVQVQGLRDALRSESLYQVWEAGKRAVEPCRRCALRYACTDCSVFEFPGATNAAVRAAYCPQGRAYGEVRSHRKPLRPNDFVQVLEPSSSKSSLTESD